ncbi:YceD family protein [Candidatus Soleaferrea massiliensis]|uniref:YceD family protein n=1 Tax=Candidatus Soleaferrea massiliensis TaxID=1470354 RepID=UPI0005901819|nr:DUF177 domain-containing protein [Candidatus Soleaferrea massiliensis]
MFIDLKQLFEVVGETKPIDYALDLSEVKLYSGNPFQTPVQIKGGIVNHAGIVELKYHARFQLAKACDRCLEDVVKDFDMAFEHILVNELNAAYSDDFILLEESKLDMDELAVSDILLELPLKILCRDDCKGLCPDCGQNLNEKECGCKHKQLDPRLQALQELLK